MTIKRLSLAPGASITVNLVAITGLQDEWRSPFPTPAAEATPPEGGVFTIAVDGTQLTVTGVAEGSGTLTLINPDVNPPVRTNIPVTVQEEAPTVQWAIDAPVVTEYAPPPPPPFEVETLVNDQRVQLTFSGTGAGGNKAIDWGDGPVENTDANPAQHDYMANGDYTITVTPDGQPAVTINVTIDHYPVYQSAVADPSVTVSHDKGDISTIVKWGDGNEDTALEDSFTHMYAANGTYEIRMKVGGFPEDVVTSVTIANAQVSGGSIPPTNATCYGPFDAVGTNFWICVGSDGPPSLGFDVDTDPDVDIQIPYNNIAQTLQQATPAQRAIIIAKILEYL